MKHYAELALVLFLAVSGFGCMRPYVGNAGYVIINKPDSRSTCVIGSNNTQANAIHSDLESLAKVSAEGNKADADGNANKASASGLFVNNSVGSRSADIDATSSMEKLSRVKDSTVGQNTGRDSSPVSATTTATNERTTSVSIPVSASQNGSASSTSDATAVPNAIDATATPNKSE